MNFSELGLKTEILKALTDMGYQDLTPIQEKTFSPILRGRDLLARAETGSGKTAACGIPLVQMIDPSLNAIQALILVPTRELALQYVEEIANIARYTEVIPFFTKSGDTDLVKDQPSAGCFLSISLDYAQQMAFSL